MFLCVVLMHSQLPALSPLKQADKKKIGFIAGAIVIAAQLINLMRTNAGIKDLNEMTEYTVEQCSTLQQEYDNADFCALTPTYANYTVEELKDRKNYLVTQYQAETYNFDINLLKGIEEIQIFNNQPQGHNLPQWSYQKYIEQPADKQDPKILKHCLNALMAFYSKKICQAKSIACNEVIEHDAPAVALLYPPKPK